MTAERLRSLVEVTSDWIWEVDEHGVYTFVNRRVHDLLGYEIHEVLGKTPLDFMTPQERQRIAPMFQDLLKSPTPISCLENTNLHKDGHLVVLETSGIPLFREDGTLCGYRGIDRDITARKEAQIALQHAKLEAEDANRAKDSFLAVVSHELRMPLAPILSAADLLEESGALSKELLDYVAIIRRNVEMEARLVDDLLDLSRIAKDKVELHLSVVDAHEHLGHVLNTCQMDITAKGLCLSLNKSATLPSIQADPTRLQQVFLNVLRNAIKFTPTGGSITITTRNPSPADLEISVRDTGKGISAEDLPRIFNDFEQGGRNVTRRFGGLGLGLAIARSLMRLHGGRITVQSDGPGKGATFTLDFPVAADVARPKPAASRAPAEHRTWRILVVEDNLDALRLIVQLLKRRGHTVQTATSVAEGIACAARSPIDLLISDIGLPDGSGTDLMRAIRSSVKRGIALSGFGMESDLERSLQAGFDAHLTKPVDFRILLEQINATMAAVPAP